MRAPPPLDLGEARRNLMRLGAAQAALLAGIVLVALLLRSLAPALLAWFALLPALVALWAWLYYRGLAAVPRGEGEKARYLDVNRRALRLLGVFAIGWTVGLVAVGFLTR